MTVFDLIALVVVYLGGFSIWRGLARGRWRCCPELAVCPALIVCGGRWLVASILSQGIAYRNILSPSGW
jgi:hypothetical protein